MFKKQYILFSILLLSRICFAETDSIAELNAKINKLDELHTKTEVQKILSQLDVIDAQQKKAAAPAAPVSPIPVAGQAVAPLPQNYPAPIPGAQATIPNILNPPAANNQGTQSTTNTMPNNIYR